MKTINLLIGFSLRLGVGYGNLDSKGFYVWYKKKVWNTSLEDDEEDSNAKILKFREDIMESIWAHMKRLGLINKEYTYRILGVEIQEDNFMGPVQYYHRDSLPGGDFPYYMKVKSISIDKKVISDMVDSIKKTGKITRDLYGIVFIENK